MRERKSKQKRLPHKVYLVICEGETEKTYVESLCRAYRRPVTIKTKVSGNSINRRLVEQYVRELGVDSDADYEIFYIYDADVECVANKLLTLPGNTILTNPCLELWYALHVIDHNRSVSSEEAVKILEKSHTVWNGYLKGRLTPEQNRLLMDNCSVAMKRAARLHWPGNPSSNMEKFINALGNGEKR